MKIPSEEFLAENGICIGADVEIMKYCMEKDGKFKLRSKRKGRIIALYPYIVTVQIGSLKESFRYSQFYETGHERVRVCRKQKDS